MTNEIETKPGWFAARCLGNYGVEFWCIVRNGGCEYLGYQNQWVGAMWAKQFPSKLAADQHAAEIGLS